MLLIYKVGYDWKYSNLFSYSFREAIPSSIKHIEDFVEPKINNAKMSKKDVKKELSGIDDYGNTGCRVFKGGIQN